MFCGLLRAEETLCFGNVVLLKRRASKIVLLPKRPSDQSKTSSNYGRETYSTHSSLTINSSTTSFFEISRSIFIARDSTTKLMFDQSSVSTILIPKGGLSHSPPPLNRIRPRILSCAIAHLHGILLLDML
ncbi:hypothetical protein F2Q70_00003162 [Brassica cretica]|uniref:Uncharacterized protein n=1 Tax=Brassica cretica TaxID=69181 RepID=A0A8S9ISP1_BRACR|nr:hypothetical protein F2Q70_00003162 [Brassica cretica]